MGQPHGYNRCMAPNKPTTKVSKAEKAGAGTGKPAVKPCPDVQTGTESQYPSTAEVKAASAKVKTQIAETLKILAEN